MRPLCLLFIITALFCSSCNASTQSQAPLSPTVETTSSNLPSTCAVTRPQSPAFVPPAPYSPSGPFPNQFWYGSNSLWTALPQDGKWPSLPHSTDGYGQKVFWWRDGYSVDAEPQPALTVTGERLDGDAPPINETGATNAFAKDIGQAMLIGVEFPTLGCWKVTGHYKDAQLSFVIWIAP